MGQQITQPQKNNAINIDDEQRVIIDRMIREELVRIINDPDATNGHRLQAMKMLQDIYATNSISIDLQRKRIEHIERSVTQLDFGLEFE